jgi:hypothetical protein
MVEILNLAYGTSWQWRRRSWMKKDEDVKLYQSNTGEMIYMP